MAQDRNIDHGYYAKIQTEGIAWSLRVNDLFVRENGDPGYVTSNGNIGLALLPGENLISLLFSPVTGEKTASGDFIFEMYDGVSIEIGIERLKFATREFLKSHRSNCAIAQSAMNLSVRKRPQQAWTAHSSRLICRAAGVSV